MFFPLLFFTDIPCFHAFEPALFFLWSTLSFLNSLLNPFHLSRLHLKVPSSVRFSLHLLGDTDFSLL